MCGQDLKQVLTGKGGIRTLGNFGYVGFQNRYIRPTLSPFHFLIIANVFMLQTLNYTCIKQNYNL